MNSIIICLSILLDSQKKSVINERVKNPDLKEDIVGSARNCARWGREKPNETRWKNPVWSLHKAQDSLMVMESLI